MPEDNQIYIFNTQELELIKNTFAENDILIYTIRKVFLQFPLTEPEKNLIKMSCTPDVISVLRKRILPEIAPVFPLGQLPSILTTLTDNLKVLTPQEMQPHLEAKQLEIKYLEQQFKVLEGGSEETIKLTHIGTLEGKDPYEQFVHMQAYLFLLGYIDPMLIMIKTIAGSKEESTQKQKERMKRNSNK